MNSLAFAESDALNQAEFFLFLANAVEVDGELTTLPDLESVSIETIEKQTPVTEASVSNEEAETATENKEAQR